MAQETHYQSLLAELRRNGVHALRVLFRLGKPFGQYLESLPAGSLRSGLPTGGGTVLARVRAEVSGKQVVGAVGFLACRFEADQKLTDILLGMDCFDSLVGLKEMPAVVATRSTSKLQRYFRATLKTVTNPKADVLIYMVFKPGSKGATSAKHITKRLPKDSKGLLLRAASFTAPEARRKHTEASCFAKAPGDWSDMVVDFRTSCTLDEMCGDDLAAATLEGALRKAFSILVAAWKEL